MGLEEFSNLKKQENSSVSRNLFLAADYLLLPNFIIRYHSLLRSRPFFFHCESIPPVFMPMGFQGQEFDSELISNILPIYREIFESDHCLGIFSHLKSTIAEFAATFQLDKIRRKLRYLPLAADMYIRKARSDETPIFVFNNSAHQDQNLLVLRGAVFAIQILDIVRRERP